MRSWNLGSDDPLELTIATESRLNKPDYANDQIWKLSLGSGDPPALALETTFGLRARGMRLFPRFIHKETAHVDPTLFYRTPRLVAFYPNFLKMSFSPINGIDVLAEYWVPVSQVVAGRIQITNSSVLPETLQFEWAGQLFHLGEGQGMAVVSMNTAYVLQGKTTGLCPVCFINGGPEPGAGPYPALGNNLTLFPGNTRQFNWAMASTADISSSFELARNTANCNWDAEISRIELLNEADTIEIHTGNPDWDAAFALAQKSAHSLIFPGNQNLPNPSFVINRQPDQGYSPRGDGSDYPYLWNGQSALDSYFLSSLILPGGIQYAEGFLRNFLHVQEVDGTIDWKPGLAGQRSRRLAQPVLATLAWQINKYKDDQGWLSEVFPGLLKFVQTWFNHDHDRDDDGYPEWDHPLQTGLEDAPIYERWQPKSQGIDISMLESPSLAAFLYRECLSLVNIAKFIHQEEAIPWLEEKACQLKKSLDASFNKEFVRYQYRDYQNHESSCGETLITFSDSGRIACRQKFKPPRRLLLHLVLQDETTRPLFVTINGYASGRRISERLNTRSFTWANGHARATSANLYSSIQSLDVQGLTNADSGWLATIDYTPEDISLFLPLWAEVPDLEIAQSIIEQCLLPKYLRPAGFASYPPIKKMKKQPAPCATRMVWNHLIGEGLIYYGRIDLATDLIKRLMEVAINSLKQKHAFLETYDSLNGNPSGELNHLEGLPPIGLFLQTIGVQKITNNEIILYGNNQYPWPVTLKYRGFSITCNSDNTVIGYPGGQTIKVNSPGPHKIVR
jgi:hypothetical protein